VNPGARLSLQKHFHRSEHWVVVHGVAEVTIGEDVRLYHEAAAKRTSFFAHLLTLTTYVVFPSWAVFLEALTTLTIPPELLKTQKIE
jgi:hypothetical protein